MFTRCAAIVLLALGAGTAQGQTIVEDSTFDDGDWSHVLLLDTPGGGSYATGQAPIGGNPSSYQQGLHHWGPGAIEVGHLFTGTGGIYDPGTQGAIPWLGVDYDFVVLPQSTNNAVATWFLIRQGSRYYVTGNWTTASRNWIARRYLSATAADFEEYIPGVGRVPGTPDFSSLGLPMEFGYTSANSTSLTNEVMYWGIDNWKVQRTAQGQDIVADSTFEDGDWFHMRLSPTPPGGSYSTGQVLSGGNPGAYQEGTHTWDPGAIYVAHLYVGAGGIYYPEVQGGIAAVGFKHDFIVLPSSTNNAVATWLLLRQDSRYFVAGLWSTASRSWTPRPEIRITAADFEEYIPDVGLVSGTPDFSNLGAPIEFGYCSSNSTSLHGQSMCWGIDNWEVRRFPEASHQWYCGSGLNMDTYTIAKDFVLGDNFQGTVGLSPPNNAAVVAGFLGQRTFLIWGQEGLVDPAAQEVMGLPISIGTSSVIITWPVPDDPTYAGYHIYSQAAGFGGGVISLTCAYDCTVGY
jgi:hypothetical protein